MVLMLVGVHGLTPARVANGFLIDRNSLLDKSLPHQNIVFVYKFSYKSNIIICAYFLNSIFSLWAQGFLPTMSSRSASPYTIAGQLNRLLQPLKYIKRQYTALERPWMYRGLFTY